MTMTEPNPVLSLLADINLTLGGLSKQQAKTAALLDAKRAEAPVWLDIQGSAICNANGVAVIGFDNHCPQGHVWMMRKLVVGGLTPSTTAAGRCDIYRGNFTGAFLAGTDPRAAIGLLGWEDFTASLPSIAVYGEGEIVAKSPERIYAIITGGTSGQEYVCTGHLQDFQEAAYNSQYNL